MVSQSVPNCKQKKKRKQKNRRKQKSQFVMIMSLFFTTEASCFFQVVTIFFIIILTNFTNYKDSHLGNLQYHTATHIIYSATVTYTTYNTIQYSHHYY